MYSVHLNPIFSLNVPTKCTYSTWHCSHHFTVKHAALYWWLKSCAARMKKLGRRIQCGLLSYDIVQTDSWLHTTSNSTRGGYSAYGGSGFTYQTAWCHNSQNIAWTLTKPQTLQHVRTAYVRRSYLPLIQGFDEYHVLL